MFDADQVGLRLPGAGTVATHVFHYQHVVAALASVFDEVRVVKRFELGGKAINRLRKPGIPKSFIQLLERRVSIRNADLDSIYWLGLMQFLPAVSVRLRAELPFYVMRLMSMDAAFWSARAAQGSALLHFTDTLGYRAIQMRACDRFVAEKRMLHHSVYDALPVPVNDFPVARPIRRVHDDMYDIEAHGSHAMIVYSSVAKKSYVSAGFDASRIHIVPLPLGDQLPRIVRQRNRNSFCFVGRGDVLKGLDLAVEAVGRLGGGARLKVAGPVSSSVIAWLKSKGWVDYLGILNRVQLRELYSTSAALVLPSAESFSLVSLEAAHHGLPVVCSDQTGAAEFLPTELVTIVEGRSVDRWTAVLASVIDVPRFRDVIMGEQDVTPALDLSVVSSNLANVYRLAMSTSAVPGLLRAHQ